MKGPATHLLRLAAALALTLLLGACSAFRPSLTPPERGGPPWIRTATARFVVQTDLDAARARVILGRLEESHAALAYLLRRRARPVENPLDVAVFERAGDFRDIAGQALNASAFFSPESGADLEPRPLIVMHDSDLLDETRMTAQHELTHRFLHERFASVPPWLDEGLATYYASARVEEQQIVLGGPSSIDISERPYFWLAWMGTFEQAEVPLYLAPPLRTLIDADFAEFHTEHEDRERGRKDRERTSAFYAASWRLVHLLMNGGDLAYRQRFQLFLDDLDRGAKGREAFNARFGDVWPGLEQAYQVYLRQERLPTAVVSYRAPVLAIDPQTQVMSAAAVHLLWARVMPWTKGGIDRVRAQIDQAAAAEPRSTDVLLLRAMLSMHQQEHAAARTTIDAALAQAPEDPRPLYALCRWYRRPGVKPAEREAVPAEIVERLARAARSAMQLGAVALLHGERGRGDVGLSYSARALAVDPLCWVCSHVHASLLLSERRYAEAAAANERSIAIAPDHANLAPLLEVRNTIATERAAPSRVVPADGGAVGDAGRVVAAMQGGFRRCFLERLRDDAETAGSVRVTARIGADGAVTRVESTSSTPRGGTLAAPLVSCVEGVVRGARFMPPEGGGATVVIPVTFASVPRGAGSADGNAKE
jgi:tetratricopeptide (TPR) repeat protein